MSKRYAVEIKKLYDKNKVITPPMVVDAARPEQSPLHPAFEWRDDLAAEQYRLYQARSLIRTVQVDRVDESEKKVPFVHCPLPSSKQGEYHPLDVVVSRPDMYAAALMELKTKLQSAQKAMDQVKSAALSADNPDDNRLAMITMAIEALKTAGQAVSSLH